jgi:hypothetical protein
LKDIFLCFKRSFYLKKQLSFSLFIISLNDTVKYAKDILKLSQIKVIMKVFSDCFGNSGKFRDILKLDIEINLYQNLKEVKASEYTSKLSLKYVKLK